MRVSNSVDAPRKITLVRLLTINSRERGCMEIDSGAQKLLAELHGAGYKAYVVGGCVRDMILGRPPHDWDITTNATPEEVLALFGHERCVPTGMKHGTISVRSGEEYYEVTTFRVDGDYSDGRHPDKVAFVSNVVEDLARRDFTINAMAYNDEEGLIDPFCGREDIARHTIRTVGEAKDRFREDALRMLRAFRFMSELNFNVDYGTFEAAREMIGCVDRVSRERVRVEFVKLLMGDKPSTAMYPFVMTACVPEIAACVGFEQHSPWHEYDVYRHICYTVDAAPKVEEIRLAAFFHDIAKPAAYTETDGIGHFRGHAPISAEVTEQAMKRLKFPNKTIDDVVLLVKEHELRFPSSPADLTRMARRQTSKIGIENVRKLIDLRKADIVGQGFIDNEERCGGRIVEAENYLALAERLNAEKQCLQKNQLGVSGKDVMRVLEIPSGKAVGEVITEIYQKVIDGDMVNDRKVLLQYLEDLKANKKM